MNSKKISILLVEDDFIAATAVQRAFRKQQIFQEIIHAKDGWEAIEILRGKKESAKIQEPYIILLDLKMPRMNGIEFLQEIRHDPKFKKAIVFVFTNSTADSDRERAYEFNIAGYIVKPSCTEGLLRVLEMLHQYCSIIEFPCRNYAASASPG